MSIEMLEYKFIEYPGSLFEPFLVLKDIGVNEMECQASHGALILRFSAD